MEEQYTLWLSLLDFVPPLAFLVGSIYLVRFSRRERGRACGNLMTAGTSLVFLGGLLKAIWKLLCAVGMGDFVVLSEQQFVLLAPGFLLMLIASVQLLRGERRGADGAVIGIAAWKIPLMAVMTISSIGAYGILSFIAIRRKRWLAAVLFVATIVLTLGMAGMASGDQSVGRQWLEEGVNSASQIAMAVASWILYRTTTVSPKS